MRIQADSIHEYLKQVPEERKPYFKQLRKTIIENLPKGFEEVLNYGMIGYVVPHSVYPAGYHCDPTLPLPFINIASQKHFIGFYHMGIYAKPELLNWFTNKYPAYCKRKLDMGKSCIRFKYMEDIPYELIGNLMQKMTAKEWIQIYEQGIKR